MTQSGRGAQPDRDVAVRVPIIAILTILSWQFAPRWLLRRAAAALVVTWDSPPARWGVLTGLPHDPASVEFFWVVRREIDVRGSMIYQDEFGEAVDLLARGAVEVAPLLTHRFPLAGIEAALGAHRDPSAIKVAVFPGWPATRAP